MTWVKRSEAPDALSYVAVAKCGASGQGKHLDGIRRQVRSRYLNGNRRI